MTYDGRKIPISNTIIQRGGIKCLKRSIMSVIGHRFTCNSLVYKDVQFPMNINI